RYGYSGYDVLTDFEAREYYDSIVVDEAALEDGLEAGALFVGNRLGDALRAIRGGRPKSNGGCHLPLLATPGPGGAAADVAAGSERDALSKVQDRVRKLEERLSAVERSVGRRLRRRIRGRLQG